MYYELWITVGHDYVFLLLQACYFSLDSLCRGWGVFESREHNLNLGIKYKCCVWLYELEPNQGHVQHTTLIPCTIHKFFNTFFYCRLKIFTRFFELKCGVFPTSNRKNLIMVWHDVIWTIRETKNEIVFSNKIINPSKTLYVIKVYA